MTALVIGVGNELRGDDAVGLVVLRLLEEQPTDARLVACEGEPVAILDAWDGFADVLLVDAMQSGAEPGTIRELDAVAAPLPAELSRPSTHLLGVAEAVELARTLDRLPARLTVFAIEGGAYEAGTGLTAPVAAAAARVATTIRERLRSS